MAPELHDGDITGVEDGVVLQEGESIGVYVGVELHVGEGTGVTVGGTVTATVAAGGEQLGLGSKPVPITSREGSGVIIIIAEMDGVADGLGVEEQGGDSVGVGVGVDVGVGVNVDDGLGVDVDVGVGVIVDVEEQEGVGGGGRDIEGVVEQEGLGCGVTGPIMTNAFAL